MNVSFWLKAEVPATSAPRPVYPQQATFKPHVRFLGVEVRSTSDSRRDWARSAKTGHDPKRPCRDKVRPHSKSQARTSQKSPIL